MHRPALRRFPFARLLLVLAIGGLWARSHWRSDCVGLFTTGGKLQLAGADRGRLLIALTSIPFGPERAFTLDYVSVPNEEFDDARRLLYETQPLPHKLAGIYLGGSLDDAFGLPN